MLETGSSSGKEEYKKEQRKIHRDRDLLLERIQRIGLPPGEDLPKIPSDFERQCHTLFEVRRFSKDEYVEHSTDDPTEAHRLIEGSGAVWIHVTGVHSAKKLRTFGDLLGLHPLTVEDVMNLWARPRVEVNKGELFFTGRAVGMNFTETQPSGQQVSLVLRENLVISFTENSEDIFKGVKSRLLAKDSRIRSGGAAFIAYSLIDTLVDRLLLVTEAIEEIVVELEDKMLDEEEQETVPTKEIYKRKRLVLRLNRIAFPLRDAIHDLHDLCPEVMSPAMDVYLRDLLDHARRAAERVEHARGMLHDLQDFHSARQDKTINKTMQFLTVIGTIFVPLTFVAGVYGMNFNPDKSPWNMPLLNSYWGYPLCMGGMFTFAIIMVVYFRKKGWL